MIDLEKAKNEFIKYTNNYDLTDDLIVAKINHSLRVMEYSKKIAESLKLSKEQIDLATLIGLLHDIARFEQRRLYGTYSDKLSIDHGNFGVELLEKDNFIRKFIDTDKYDDIIKTAIRNHNKYKIEDLDGEKLIQSQIIKDADKLDIFYLVANEYYRDVEVTENSEISEDYLEQLRERNCIYRKADETQADELVLITSFIYDIYFDYSLKIIKDEKYIEKIFNQFNFKSNIVKKQVQETINIANEYFSKIN